MKTRLWRDGSRLLRSFLLLLFAVAGSAVAAAPPTTIRVVLDDNYPPYTFRDGNGQPQGILKDLWMLWQARTGITVDYQPMDWAKAQALMNSGKADVIDTPFQTDERRKIYSFSQPYASIEVAIFFHESIGGITDAASLKGFTVGVKDGDASIEYLHSQGITDLKRYASYEALVKAAVRQEIRLMCIDKPPAIYFLNREGAAEQFRHSAPLYVGQFHWAVARGNDELKRIVEQGFALISPEERRAIETRWLGSKVDNVTLSAIATHAVPVFAGVVATLLLLTVWTLTLRRRVAQRTAELSSALNSLRDTEKRFRTLFEQANDSIFILRGSTIIDCNKCAEILNGLPRDKIVGQEPFRIAPPLQPDGRSSEQIMHEMNARAEAGQPVVFEWRTARPDGASVDLEVSLSRIDIGGENLLQAIARDITERKLAEAEIQRLAYFDPLTQLPNRRMLGERLRQALAAARRRHSTGAVLFIDLDNFKTLNDTRGHDVGDHLLLEVGRRLRAGVRAEDFIARLGGDEFVVLLEDLHDSPSEAAAQAEAVAEKVLETIDQPFLLDALEHHTTTSIGICLFAGDDHETAEEILKRADAAMYRSKTAGRNTLRFFDPALQSSLEGRASMEAELRRALPLQQLHLVYQPMVDRDGRIMGAEALLRWQHPERGLVAPGQFIALAEDTGLIVPIGQWVLETACAQLATWQTRPSCTTSFSLAVNVSARQFRQDQFVVMVSDIVTGSGIDPARLTLELTESLVLENVADAVEKMHTLRTLGINFAIDDFGTGHSSLAYLKRLPFAKLKIDQSFVRDLATDPGDEVIVRTIIAMANSLGLSVIAEGVETPAQRDFLIMNGCESFQGYLFARPVPCTEFDALLDRQA